MMRQVYELALASAFYSNGAVHYWNHSGFQACGFTRPWFEALLGGWRTVLDYPPEKPLRTPVFFSSHASRRAHESYVAESPYPTIPDVRNSAAEVVSYAYEQWRRRGGAAAALAWLDEAGSSSSAPTNCTSGRASPGTASAASSTRRRRRSCGCSRARRPPSAPGG
jgi:hypothetical protein